MLIVILLTALLLRPSADLLCLTSLHRRMMHRLLRENLLYLRFPEGIVQIILDSVDLTLVPLRLSGGDFKIRAYFQVLIVLKGHYDGYFRFPDYILYVFSCFSLENVAWLKDYVSAMSESINRLPCFSIEY